MSTPDPGTPPLPEGGTRHVSADGGAGDAGGCLALVVLPAAAITGLLALFWTLLWLGALPASLAAAGWKPVPGLLTQANYSGSCSAKVSGGGPTHPLSLSYTYAWAGKAHTGHLLGPTRWHHQHRSDCGRGVPDELRAGLSPTAGGKGLDVTVYLTLPPAKAGGFFP